MVLQQCTGEAKQEVYCKNKCVILSRSLLAYICSRVKVWRVLRYHPEDLLHFLQVPWIDNDISKSNWVSTVLRK
jgi:hypothetical protein